MFGLFASPILQALIKPLLILAAIGMLFGVGYMKGYNSAARSCETAALETELKVLRRDIEIAKAAAASAEARAKELADEVEKANGEIDAYEKELATRPADQRCTLGRIDVDRLHKILGQ
jgi:chromosome segregation ATPase